MTSGIVESRADLSLPDLDFGGVMPDDLPDIDAAIVHSPNSNGQHAPAIDNPRLSAALAYAGRGWKVLPLHAPIFRNGQVLCTCYRGAQCDSTGKHPQHDKDLLPHGVHSASNDPDLIRRWWAKWPWANVGIETGSRSGLDVLDIDPKHGGDETIAELIRQYDGLPETPIQITGGGGNHLIFAYSGRIGNKVGFASGLDTRSDGGLIVVEPSIHASGRQYTWEVTAHPDDMPLASMPEWLIALITKAQAKQQSIDGQATGGDRIADGQRNSTLASLAGSMRRRGFGPDAIESALLIENQSRCDPPLPESEVKVIARSVARYEPKPLTERCELTDMGNARRLALRYGHVVKFSKAWGWLFYNGAYWQRDDVGTVKRVARVAVRAIYSEAQFAANEDTAKKIGKWAVTSQSQQHLKAMIDLAESEPEIITTPDQFDRDVMLFNVQNGTLDLRTGELRPHNPADMITKIAGAEFDPDATCPIWLGFLDRIMAGKRSLIGFLQRGSGYTLTGDTSEQVLFFDYGTGANGKSVLHETVRAVLGDYGQAAEFSTFLMRQSDSIRNDIARLAGARFVSAIEAGEGRRLSEVLVKSLTGSDTVTARFLQREFFEFRPRFKLWLAANHKPVIRGTDYAIWRRIRLIPFVVTIPEDERDPHLADKLRGELPGILAWAVQGCLDWQREGLGTPDEVRQATEAYRSEMDTLAAFLDECCVIAGGAKVAASELYTAYKSWCDQNGEHAENQRGLKQRLIERGYRQERKGTGLKWQGLGLLSAEATNEK